MKVYFVYGNTWFGGYGEYIHTFGVFRTRELAERVKTQKEDEYFKLDQQQGLFHELDNRSDVEFKIKKLEVDKTIDKSLGGYAE